ncbi:MAG: hypothetical protein CL820_14065 [Croceicoccus sp.]|nr:hypothetical protein [Croceicoccus sp.]|tara:strand:- start:3064 stop:3282 length:219 start_codon:yes stop_codon:yes gene_type:complete
MVKNDKKNGTGQSDISRTIYLDRQDAIKALHQKPRRLRDLAGEFAGRGETDLAKELEDLADEIERINRVLAK